MPICEYRFCGKWLSLQNHMLNIFLVWWFLFLVVMEKWLMSKTDQFIWGKRFDFEATFMQKLICPLIRWLSTVNLRFLYYFPQKFLKISQNICPQIGKYLSLKCADRKLCHIYSSLFQSRPTIFDTLRVLCLFCSLWWDLKPFLIFLRVVHIVQAIRCLQSVCNDPLQIHVGKSPTVNMKQSRPIDHITTHSNVRRN
jgi:hypothetical protein